MNRPAGSAATVELLNHLTGHWRAQAIHVAAQLRIADLLADEGARTPCEISERVGANADAVHRLLRALASLGIFRERADGRFELTPAADALREAPGSLRALAVSLGGAAFQAWGDALYSVRTGKPAFERLHGRDFFTHLAEREEAGEAFAAAMSAQTRLAHAAVASSYPFPRGSCVVDVGGGDGTLLEMLLRAGTIGRGLLLDRPEVVERARRRIASSDVAPRLALVAGDFFEAVPPGGDVYMLTMVVHDWDDDRAERLLRRCYEAMAPGSAVVLSELVIPAGNAPFFGKLLDLDMLVNLGGRERTATQYEHLLARAGFAGARLVPVRAAGSALSLVEARRP
jgi:hypothetical protein